MIEQTLADARAEEFESVVQQRRCGTMVRDQWQKLVGLLEIEAQNAETNSGTEVLTSLARVCNAMGDK